MLKKSLLLSCMLASQCLFSSPQLHLGLPTAEQLEQLDASASYAITPRANALWTDNPEIPGYIPSISDDEQSALEKLEAELKQAEQEYLEIHNKYAEGREKLSAAVFQRPSLQRRKPVIKANKSRTLAAKAPAAKAAARPKSKKALAKMIVAAHKPKSPQKAAIALKANRPKSPQRFAQPAQVNKLRSPRKNQAKPSPVLMRSPQAPAKSPSPKPKLSDKFWDAKHNIWREIVWDPVGREWYRVPPPQPANLEHAIWNDEQQEWIEIPSTIRPGIW